MLFAHSLKLLGLFLSLSIFASGTPIDIVSSPAALERRVSQAAKDECPAPSRWIRRECTPDEGPEHWREVCQYDRTSPFLHPFFTYVRNACPKDYICAPDVDDDGDDSIKCIPPEKEEDGRSRKKQKTSGAQYGTSQLVTAASGNKNTQIEVDAVIDHDIPGASVSAMFTSTDNSFVVAPNNIIVGKIKGTEITVCKGDKNDPGKARECYPTGQHNLKAKQKVNFTMGLTNGQSGYVHYAAIPDQRIIHDELR